MNAKKLNLARINLDLSSPEPSEYAQQLRSKANECVRHANHLLKEARAARHGGSNRLALKLVNQASLQIDEANSLRKLAEEVDQSIAKKDLTSRKSGFMSKFSGRVERFFSFG